jgi:hypothetical protein
MNDGKGLEIETNLTNLIEKSRHNDVDLYLGLLSQSHSDGTGAKAYPLYLGFFRACYLAEIVSDISIYSAKIPSIQRRYSFDNFPTVTAMSEATRLECLPLESRIIFPK